MKLRVNVQYASTAPGLPDEASITRWARTALAGPDQDEVEIGVRIVDEDEITQMNRRFRNETGSTNVLAFPFGKTPEVQSNLLGDIVICAPVVRREARAQNKQISAHWAHMVVHAIMHLRGYDHRTPGDAHIMEGIETHVLKRLGFPDPYTPRWPPTGNPDEHGRR
ncbi:MAG: rRNA maturation RNase YbeY [Acidiferrobacterales bacterium]|jgi:probable rRNA maturation factor